jgi:hypothetical protein
VCEKEKQKCGEKGVVMFQSHEEMIAKKERQREWLCLVGIERVRMTRGMTSEWCFLCVVCMFDGNNKNTTGNESR